MRYCAVCYSEMQKEKKTDSKSIFTFIAALCGAFNFFLNGKCVKVSVLVSILFLYASEYNAG